MFYYLDIPRLSWGFSTPNMLAAFLTVLLAAVITAGDLPCLQKRFLQAGLWVLLIAGEILLGLTYSRGGYLAWLTVLAVYYFITRRKKVFVCLLTFFAVLVIIPAGIQRAASSANISEGSIANRLYLWRGALGTVAEFPVSGSPYPIGDYYELQYMPPEINAEYRNFLNDILTLGGNYGLGAIFAAVFLLLFLLYTGISCYRQCGFAPLPGLTAGIAGAFIAGCFSTFYHVARIRNAWIMLAAALSAGIVWCCIRKKWHFRLHHLLFPAAGAAVITIAIYTAGKAVTVPYKVIPEWENQKFTFIPIGSPAAEVVFFYPAEDIYGGKLPPPDVRQYAVKGIKIHLCGIDSGLDGLAKAEAFLEEILSVSSEVHIAGSDLAAANAFVAAAKFPRQEKIRNSVFLNMATEWPLPELSPANYLAEADFPFRLLQQQMQPEEIMQYIIQQKNQQERIK